MWGLALSSKQTHDAITILISDRQKPKTLPLQGAILVRSMLELLGNVMALLEDRSRFHWFLADGYKQLARMVSANRSLFGGNSRWIQWFAQMDILLAEKAKRAKLTKSQLANPETIIDWPTPKPLMKGRPKIHPKLLSGQRARVFEEAYRYWYAELSAYSHQRVMAAERAVFADNIDLHWEPGAIESIVVSEAILFFAAILAELQSALGVQHSLKLRLLWADLIALDELGKLFAEIRYRQLLLLPDP
jgi:hypothetical protein